MIFHLMTDPTPEEFFMHTNMKAMHGDIVLCILTQTDVDYDLYQKDSQHAKEILTLLGLMMLQEPLYVGCSPPESQKEFIIETLNHIKNDIIG